MGRKALAVRASLEREKRFDEFVEQLKMDKIEEFIVKSAKITYKKRDEKEEK
jgi:hypothetical protein